MLTPRTDVTSLADLVTDFENADFEKMSEIRDRIDAIVTDRATAQALKAWYRQLCKRPCFHDEYLAAYNRPNVHLVDTDGQGVERITATGVVVAGVEHEVDCIIYASGFEVGTGATRRNGFDVTGRDGVTLSDHWADGMRSLHGMHVHGFPNVFLVQPAQGANFLPNVPHNLADSARTIAAVVGHAMATGAQRVEVTAEAEEAWLGELVANPMMVGFLMQCTPGYYNNEGHELGPDSAFFGGYPQGASAFFRYIDGWRTDGRFTGLTFT
jgi:cyclohexanone monooxygenase